MVIPLELLRGSSSNLHGLSKGPVLDRKEELFGQVHNPWPG